MGSKTKICIPLEGNNGPFLVIGTIVCLETLGKDKFDIGVSFLEMEKSAKSEISKYIKHY